MPPLIGITGYRNVINTSTGPNLLGVTSSDDYAQGIEAAGGMPVIIPYVLQESTWKAMAESIDGLVLGGGEDVDPLLFGASPNKGLGEVVPERDALEIFLIREMMRMQKPIFGICRGMQVLNVALGGSLYQDLETEWPGHIQHKQYARRNHLSHQIHIEPASQLYRCMGEKTMVRCNSFHHQGVRDVAVALRAVAWDDEGLVEAIEMPGHPFVLAVQWHPENLWRTAPDHHGLFHAFVQATMRV